jgi:hypothetical protein
LRRAGIALAAALAVALFAEASYRAVLYVAAGRHGAEEFEIYGVGESTMVGEPFHPKISVPVLLEHMFGGVMAGRPIRVINLAERGSPIYPQSIAFAEALTTRNPATPGIVLIMSGHNESFAPGYVPERPFLPSAISEKSAIVRDLLLALRRHHWIERERSPAASEYYLRQVIEMARANGLTPILATMASNVSRIEPNVEGTVPGSVVDAVTEGLTLEKAGRFAEASDLYRARLVGTSASVEREYRLGRCAEALGDYAAAREHYWTAVDHDPRLMFGRATRPQNQRLRDLAREYGVPLVDAVQMFEDHSPHGILGDDLFMDGQHPTVTGYVLLADAYAAILAQRFDTPITHPLSDAAAATAALGFEPRDEPHAAAVAGSWLIATSVGHPFPHDRMALAEERFAAALGKGDDFSMYFGIALAEAASRDGMLRNPDDVRTFAGLLSYVPSYSVPPNELPALLARLQRHGVDERVIEQLRRLGAGGAGESRGDVPRGH